MLKRRIHVQGARVLVMGLAFKENCPDLRNTRVIDVIAELRDFGVKVDVHDPWINPAEAEAEYGITPVASPEPGTYDATILAVAHQEFRKQSAESLRRFGKPGHILYDLKYVLPADQSDLRL